MINMDESCVEKQNTFCVQLLFFTLENLAFNQIMWKNIAEPAKPLIKIWRIRISCWLPKATRHTQNM